MAIGDFYTLTVKAENIASGDDAVNVLCFQQQTGLVLDEPGEDLVEAWQDTCQPLYITLLSSAYTLTGLTVRAKSDPEYIYEASGLNVNGTSTGDCLPPVSAPLVSLRTGFAGRRNRGRIYMPPTSELHQVAGVLQTTYTDAWADYIDSMLPAGGGLEFAQWQLSVWSEANNAGRPVTTYLLRTILATQRRRRPGVGS